MLSLYINNQKVFVPAGSSVLEACKQVGIDIPRFCYHEALSVAGNCRMCLVEIEKSPKPIAACAMPAASNMVVFTDTPLVKKARENVLEILLLNHPLDCPICDQGGECDLQDQTRLFGGDYSRFYITKRSVEDKYCGPLIKTIMTRCIHCTRCVRFASEIAGVDTLGTLNRGEHTEIGAYIERLFNTEISGNVIDLCPVGALTSKPYAFTARPWELRNVNNIDVLDCVGSNISVEFKETEIVRITPRFSDEINGEWISDKIRFFYDGLRLSRLGSLFLKGKKNFEKINWETALNIIKQYANNNFLIILNSSTDLHTILALSNLNNKNIKIRFSDIASYQNFTNNTHTDSFRQIKNADACFLLGTNIKIEAPVLQIKLRSQFLKGNFLTFAVGVPSNTTMTTTFISLNLNSFLKIFEGKSILQQIISFCKQPFFFIGKSITSRISNHELKKQLILLNKNAKILTIDSTPNLKAMSINKKFILTKNDLKWAHSILLFDLEDIKQTREIMKLNKNIIWANTHGSKLANKAKLIVPLTSFFETKNYYINAESRLQATNKVLPISDTIIAPKNLLLNIFDTLNKQKIETQMDEIKSIFINPNLLNKKRFNLIKSKTIITDPIKGTLYPLKSNIEDFYLTNKYTRASSIMGQTSQIFRKDASNFVL